MLKEKIHRAGLICYRVIPDVEPINGVQMLFMQPSDEKYGGDKYQCPKGKVEHGETAVETAIREAQEEVGLFKGSMLTEPKELGTFLGRTTFFVCKVSESALFGEPSFETSDTRWMTLGEFIADGRALHVPVVQAAYRKILRLEGYKQDDPHETVDNHLLTECIRTKD